MWWAGIVASGGSFPPLPLPPGRLTDYSQPRPTHPQEEGKPCMGQVKKMVKKTPQTTCPNYHPPSWFKIRILEDTISHTFPFREYFPRGNLEILAAPQSYTIVLGEKGDWMCGEEKTSGRQGRHWG